MEKLGNMDSLEEILKELNMNSTPSFLQELRELNEKYNESRKNRPKVNKKKSKRKDIFSFSRAWKDKPSYRLF